MENSSTTSNNSSRPPTGLRGCLERIGDPSASNLVQSIRSFIISFSNKPPDPEKDSALFQEFLNNMEVAFRSHSLWATCSDEELESTIEGLEKYVMRKLYNQAFASVPEEVNSDKQLFEKIRLLQQFIQPKHLDIKPAFQNESSYMLAQKELQKISSHKAPRDKLMCIFNCCKVINDLLLNVTYTSGEYSVGADDFLPVLIYVIIKANPPQLHSNLLYIQRYRCQSRLVSEVAYYFTNFLSAVYFIRNLNAESLSIDKEEFQKEMDNANSHILGLSFKTSHDIYDHITNTSNESISNLTQEGKGPAELTKNSQINAYFEAFPFMYANAGDLTVDDVHELLDCYKRLVLVYLTRSKENIDNVKDSKGGI